MNQSSRKALYIIETGQRGITKKPQIPNEKRKFNENIPYSAFRDQTFSKRIGASHPDTNSV